MLENLTTLSLYRQLCLMEGQDGKERSPGYLRTKDGREVDFVLVAEGSPVLQIEVKAADSSISPRACGISMNTTAFRRCSSWGICV